MVSDGTNLALVGGAMFLAGLVFFEGIIGISGERPEILSTGVLPAILVGIGLLVVARSIFFPTRPSDGGTGTTHDSGATAA